MGSIEHTKAIISTNDNETTDTARAAAEVQSAIIVARKFPRNESESKNKIMQACQRKKLAEQSAYSFSRGGAEVTGPSIRLAEEVARCWGNIQYGIREIQKDSHQTLYEVFCWDLESNIKVTRTFSQDHMRHTKKGVKHLTDSRDVYELVASNAARRLRAVILEVLPNFIIEDALEECTKTLTKDQGKDKTKIVESMLSKFEAFKIDQKMIEKRIGRKLETITQQQIIDLGKIYQSLADGMSSTEQWFEDNQKPKEKKSLKDELQDEIKV